MKEMLEVPQLKIALFPKMSKVNVNNDQDLIKNALIFEDFINSIGVLAVELDIIAEQVSCNAKQKAELYKITHLSQVLPFIQRYLTIIPIEGLIIKDTFSEYFQHLATIQQSSSNEHQSKIVL